jgi:transposase
MRPLDHNTVQLSIIKWDGTLDIHLIVDNYSTHKSAAVQRWLRPKKRRRFHVHFTPTSSSWLNRVERWFGLITDRMIRRGTFHSVAELERAIYQWLANWNHEPQPFIWRATADVILDKVRRCKELAGNGTLALAPCALWPQLSTQSAPSISVTSVLKP